MRRLAFALSLLVLAPLAWAQTKAEPAAPAKPASLVDRSSYTIGLSVGRSLGKDKVQVNKALIMKGIEDGIAGAKPVLTDEEMQAAMTELQQQVQTRREEELKAAAAKNRKDGEAFLAANKQRKGVTTLPSGLQYEVVKEGAGAKPKATDTVTVHYRGTRIDGTEFDSSYGRKEPASFTLGEVIPGWIEAVQLMPIGSKWKIYLPADLAYGDKEVGDAFGPGSTLVFEIELVSIGEKPKVEAPK